jgi:DNA-3-methyladenine glycosylase I
VTGPTIGEVVIGKDGKPRCPWAGVNPSPVVRYHDQVWGRPTKNSSALFEALTLGVFEVGLSWRVVFGKRDAFRRAFHDFNVERISALKETDVDRLVKDPSIIRNRAKISATIANARTMQSASPSLRALVAAHSRLRHRAPRLEDVPTTTPEAEALAAQLKFQGYRFVGPTSVYAFMQNVGAVNDHIRGCFRAIGFTSSS